MPAYRRPLVFLASGLLLAVAAAGLLGVVTAQVGDDCGPISLDPSSSSRQVDGNGLARIPVDVTNEGAVGGTAWVNVSSGPGWSTDVQPGSFTLNATETKQVEVTAGPVEEDAAQPFDLGITGELNCQVAGMGTGGSASTEESVSLQLQSASSGEGGSGNPVTDNPVMGLMLVGAVAILTVVGYPIIRKRAGPSVEISTPEPAKHVAPDKGVSFPVVVRNTGREAGTFDVTLEDVGDDWSGFLAVPDVTLDAGEERTVRVLVRPPGNPASGARTTFRVRAAPEDGGDGEVVELAAHVNGATSPP